MKNLLKIFVIAFCLMIFSCSGGIIGYGVVNWSLPEYNLVAGDIVPVYVKSNVSKAYIARVGESEDSKKEIPLWQLSFFKSKTEAEHFKTKMSDTLFQYAKVTFDGLPMRSEPENTSKQIYRLREGQTIKVLWKGDGVPVLRNGKAIPGDWYEVITEDGTRGWCFSLNLSIYDEREKKEENTEPSIVQSDNILADVLSKNWYPENYAKMIAVNRIDIENISQEHGFLPGLKSGIARIVLPELELDFPYSRISKSDGNVYKFEGSNLSMQVRGANRISVQFTDTKGSPDVEYFVTLKTSPEELIEKELQRRKSIIKGIANRGPNFNSESYGKLQILENGVFLWSGYKVISPSIIPAGAGSSGKVSIRFFVSPKMSSNYDGVLSFKFDETQDEVHFLYALSPNGLQLEFIDTQNIEESVAKKRNLNPVILFFAPEGK
ncbi:MAG: SH3 domain-containing protein [Treponema sp.]|nr:MAG: SH3 domain-containing protein [Treponema sp.]